jgi:hypothetical protein
MSCSGAKIDLAPPRRALGKHHPADLVPRPLVLSDPD